MNFKIISFFAMFSAFGGCTKFVQVQPPNTEIVGTSVYSSNATAASAVTGIYQTMLNNSVGGGEGGISASAGLSADELGLYPGASTLLNQVYINLQQSNNPPTIWSDLYYCLYQGNYAIQNLTGSTGVTPAMQNQLIGEAKFSRAFCLFYLTNLYGDVPLVTSPAYQINEGLARTPQQEVYQQIIADLSNAQNLLSNTYVASDGSSTSLRLRPNQGAAAALLARTYLFAKNWDSAAIEASMVINNSQYALDSLGGVFLISSPEAIWQLQPAGNGYDTQDGALFVNGLISGGPSTQNPVYLNPALINSFEANDLRRSSWTDSAIENGIAYYFPYKYKIAFTSAAPTEYAVVLRLAEQYLIRAEAEANGAGGGVSQAIGDLNTIRNRAGLPNYAGSLDQGSVISAILHERRVELFTEYGHRWFDLQRSGMIDSVMTPACAAKGGTWSQDWELYPIPLTEIQSDSKLTQNNGYN
jgi:starch-binding outer membrane protein, SusD/RagB family